LFFDRNVQIDLGNSTLLAAWLAGLGERSSRAGLQARPDVIRVNCVIIWSQLLEIAGTTHLHALSTMFADLRESCRPCPVSPASGQPIVSGAANRRDGRGCRHNEVAAGETPPPRGARTQLAKRDNRQGVARRQQTGRCTEADEIRLRAPRSVRGDERRRVCGWRRSSRIANDRGCGQHP